MQMMTLINCICNVIRAAYPIAKDIWVTIKKLKAEKRANVSQPDKQG